MMFVLVRAIPLLCLFLMGPMPVAAAAGEPPADETTATITYDSALLQAREELRTLEEDGKLAEGWGLSEVLSIVALMLALVLMLLATRWSRRLFSRRLSGGEMRLVDRMAVGRQSNLLIVRLRGTDYWLAETPGSITLLAEWPASTTLSTPAPPRKTAESKTPEGP